MIIFNGNEISGIYINNFDISSVYYGPTLVWAKSKITGLESCYAMGYWIDEYTWTDEDVWSDNPNN